MARYVELRRPHRLTGSIVEPMGKGAGVVVVAEGDQAHVEPLG